MKRPISSICTKYLTALLFFSVPTLVQAEPATAPSEASKTVESSATPQAMPQAAPSISLPRARVCTAKAGNNYHRFGVLLKEKLKGVIDIEVLETRGSWENLEMIDANPRRCDAVIAQEDAYTLYRMNEKASHLTMDRTAKVFAEYVHLMCHRGVKASNILDLDPETHEIVINKYGSGAYITWNLFQRLNPEFKKYKVLEKTVDEAMLRIIDEGRPSCFFFVSAPGGETLKTANDVFGDQLRLVSVQDPQQERPVGLSKRQIYWSAEIPAGRYSKLAAKGLKTHTVAAVFFTSPEWKARHAEASSKLSSALLSLIRARKSGEGESP